MCEISFKKKIINTLKSVAPKFKDYYIDNEYLIFSSKMKERRYYIISSNTDNFMHLTGIKYLSAEGFFDKCVNGDLKESDININNTEEKGNIRRKITVLSNIINLFSKEILIQENYKHNKISCSIASTDFNVTLGFCSPSSRNVVRPKTLLKGCSGFAESAFKPELVLVRKKGEKRFSRILYGNSEIIKFNDLTDLVTPNIL